MPEPRSKWPLIGCVALASAAIAFVAGMLVSAALAPGTGSETRVSRDAASGSQQTGRSAFSPRVITDRFVIEQQTKVVEAMELNCRQFGQQCAEAKQARKYIDAHAPGD